MTFSGIDVSAFDDGSVTFELTETLSSSPSPASEIVVLDTVSDQPIIGSEPNDGSGVTFAGTISGTSEPFASVEIFDDGVSLQTVFADAAGEWVSTADILDPEAGESFELTAIATDNYGNDPSVVSRQFNALYFEFLEDAGATNVLPISSGGTSINSFSLGGDFVGNLTAILPNPPNSLNFATTADAHGTGQIIYELSDGGERYCIP